MGLFSKTQKEVDETRFFYNDELREFERLNTKTKNIYELERHTLLVILNDGSNKTRIPSRNASSVIYVSVDFSQRGDSINDALMKSLAKCTNLRAIVATNLRRYKPNYLNMFSNHPHLTTISGLDTWNIESFKSISGLFSNCPNLTTIKGLESWKPQKGMKVKNLFSGSPNVNRSDFPNISHIRHIDLIVSDWKEDHPVELTLNDENEYTAIFDSMDDLLKVAFGGDVITIRYSVRMLGSFEASYLIIDDVDYPNSTEIPGTDFRRIMLSTDIESTIKSDVAAAVNGGDVISLKAIMLTSDKLFLVNSGRTVKVDKNDVPDSVRPNLDFSDTRLGSPSNRLSTMMSMFYAEVEILYLELTSNKVKEIPQSPNMTIYRYSI